MTVIENLVRFYWPIAMVIVYMAIFHQRIKSRAAFGVFALLTLFGMRRRLPFGFRIAVLAVAAALVLLSLVVWYFWPPAPRSIHVQRVATLAEHVDPFTVATFSGDGQLLAVSDFKHNRRVPTGTSEQSKANTLEKVETTSAISLEGPDQPVSPLPAKSDQVNHVTRATVQIMRIEDDWTLSRPAIRKFLKREDWSAPNETTDQ